MRFVTSAHLRTISLTGVILLVGCSSASAPSASAPTPTTAPTQSLATAPTAGASPTSPTPAASVRQSALPLATPTADATASPSESASGLAGVFSVLGPVLATFGGNSPVIVTGEEAIREYQSSLDQLSEMFPGDPQLEVRQREIDSYRENGLAERASMGLRTTPSAGMIIYRFESEAGAEADFQARNASCDDVSIPGAEDVVGKVCTVVDSHHDVHLLAYRGDLVVDLSVRDVPEGDPLEPAIATLSQIFTAVDALLPG